MTLPSLLCAIASFLIPTTVAGQAEAVQSSQASQSADTSQRDREQQAGWLTPLPERGARLHVEQRSGNRIIGELVEVFPSSVRLRSAGIVREVRLNEIVSVRRHGDSLWNGMAWGAGVAAMMVVNYNGDCDTCYSAGELAAHRLAVVGIGAGVGGLLDWLVRDRRILYRAPSTASASRRLEIYPLVARQARGLLWSVHW